MSAWIIVVAAGRTKQLTSLPARYVQDVLPMHFIDCVHYG